MCSRFTGSTLSKKLVVRKQLRRSQMLAFLKVLPPCLIGMEACATAHYWHVRLTKLGHTVRLMPARDREGLRQRNKNDVADAEAICEAVQQLSQSRGRNRSAALDLLALMPSVVSSARRLHEPLRIVLCYVDNMLSL
jgi:transposase